MAKIPPGFYTADELAKELTTSAKDLNEIQNFKIEVNKPDSVLKFTQPNNNVKLIFASELAAFQLAPMS